MTKQKDAVFNAITAAAENGLEGTAANEFAIEQVKLGLMSGDIQHTKGAFTDEKKARSYAGSLISNWRKKDERLNGGVDYVPATRRGPLVKDERLKTLKASLASLKAHGGDQDLVARVEQAIEGRKAELASEKSQSKVKPMEEALADLEALGIEIPA